MADRALHIPKKITSENLEKMNECASLFIGKHNFKAFKASGSSVNDTVRTVSDAFVKRYGDEIIYSVRADGFLYNMVRIMVGTLIDLSGGQISEDNVRKALITGERSLLGFTAPSCGLYLNRVIYPEIINWKAE